MMKMMYSLSTGRPPIGESSGARRYCAPSNRFISSVSSCCAATSCPSSVVRHLSLLRREARYCPRTATGRRAAARASAAPPRAGRSRLSGRGSAPRSPRISTSSSCSLSSGPAGPARDFSSATGSPTLVSTSSRMIAPNPQQIASRNDRLKTSTSRRPSRGASWPVPRRAQERAVGAARQRPEGARRHRVALHRQQDHVDRDASAAACRSPLEELAAGRRRRWSCATAAALAPCVGRPSVMRMMLSGAGSACSATANAFSRLVPSCGHGLAQLRRSRR